MGKRKSSDIDRVSIRPGVSVLSVLSHLNYKEWFALAEFVDNAVQSHAAAREQIASVDPGGALLRVDIEVSGADGGRIVIRDNAAGIARAEFPRAFRPAEIPQDRSGLSEFGMGMKSAACWFAPRWTVRTSALGEPVEREVAFDIGKIVADSIDELGVTSRPASPADHFTEVVLTDLHHTPVGRTLGKIRTHLGDIYRLFVRDGLLELRFNGELLTHDEPEVLTAPYYRDPSGEPRVWRKHFSFDFGDGLSAHGFAAIRRVASTSRAGFALFRRRRLIQGSGDEGYRPEAVLGKPNAFPYQRVFGEIHLEGFEVSHTKDGFRWDENEEPFLDLLKEELSKPDMPLLQQAREHRVERSPTDYTRGASQASQRTTAAIVENAPPVLCRLEASGEAAEPERDLPEAAAAARRTFRLELHGQVWEVVLELSTDPAVGDWLELSDGVRAEDEDGVRQLGLRLSLVHPFMQRFGGASCEEIEPLLRVAAAMGLAEAAARTAGVPQAGAVRRNVNELLRNALHRP